MKMIAPPHENGGIGEYVTTLGNYLDFERCDLLGKSLLKMFQKWPEGDVHIQHEYAFFGARGWSTPLFLLWARLSGDVYITFHEVLGHEDIENPPIFPKRLYLTILHTLVCLLATETIFLSPTSQEKFEDTLWWGTTEFVPHGLVLDPSQPTNPERLFESDREVVAHIGYINKRKGHKTTLDLARQYPEKNFLIAGGPRKSSHKLLYKELQEEAPKNVYFTGVLEGEDFHRAFMVADLVLLPYESISQSGILHWAASHQVPVLASKIPFFEKMERIYGYPQTSTFEELPEEVHVDVELFRKNNSFEEVAELHQRFWGDPLGDTTRR